MTDRRHCFPPFVCTVVHLCICKLEHDILKKMNEMIVLQIGTSHPQGRGLLIHYCTGSNISSICGCSSAEAVLHCVSLRPELFVVSGFSLTVYLQLGLWLLSLCVMQRQCGLDMCGLTKACIGSAVASHCHPWHDHRPLILNGTTVDRLWRTPSIKPCCQCDILISKHVPLIIQTEKY